MFKFIFFFFLIITFVAPVRRFLFWLIVGRQLNNLQKKHQQQTTQPIRPEGEIKVDVAPKKTSSHSNNSGQYIDYEEVE